MKRIRQFLIVLAATALCMLPFAPYTKAEEANLISFIDIGNVWTQLDPVHSVPFTAELNPAEESLTDLMEIQEEKWTGQNGDVITSTDTRPAVLDEVYKYSITLKAKDNYRFNTESIRFIYGGKAYEPGEVTFSYNSDGNILTIEDFIGPQTVSRVSIKNATITKETAKKTYTGKALTPNVTVNTEDGLLLQEDQDYKVSYKNNKNAGTATIIVTGVGNYIGSEKTTFKILPKKVTPSAKLAKSVYVYNGKKRTPSVTVKVKSIKCKRGTDYSVKYASGRKNVGKYKITVRMKGNYKGSKSVSFRINPQSTTISSLVPGIKNMTVNWKSKKAQVTGYQIQYSRKKSFSSGKKTITIKGTSKHSRVISKLKAKKTYFVRVRIYKIAGGTKYYSKWSGIKSAKIKAPPVKKSSSASSSATGGGIVYWTPSGGVYHLSRGCPTLSRSRTVYSGTIAQSGKPRACKVCGH